MQSYRMAHSFSYFKKQFIINTIVVISALSATIPLQSI